MLWPGTESNRRHADFQSAALPTELPGHYVKYFLAPTYQSTIPVAKEETACPDEVRRTNIGKLPGHT